MKLRVTGVETIQITDPDKVCGKRKNLDRQLLKSLQGREFSAKQLKQMFGYAENTALCDTQLASLVEPVKKGAAPHGPHHITRLEEKSTKWRVL